MVFKVEIHFEQLNSNHFKILHHWYNKLHVQTFYSLREWTFEEICKKMISNINSEKKSFIIQLNHIPIGYIQSFPLIENKFLSEEIIKKGRGLDLFIGEEAYLYKGLGALIIKSFLKKYIWPAFHYCIVDPDKRNEPSLRLFQKCGFKPHLQIDSINDMNKTVSLQVLIKKKLLSNS